VNCFILTINKFDWSNNVRLIHWLVIFIFREWQNLRYAQIEIYFKEIDLEYTHTRSMETPL